MQEHVVIRHSRKHSDTSHTRDRRGCLTCRKRKKKCVGSEGRCDDCQRLNLKCEWEPERHIPRTTSPVSPTQRLKRRHTNGAEQVNVLIKAPDPLQFWLQEGENVSSPAAWNRRVALRYYVQSFAAILSCNIENNGFLSVLLPMAMESPPLLDTMIACSSSHLALCRTDLQLKALEHKSSALTSFASSFKAGDLTQEFSLAACLILCSMESILGDTWAWYEHLSGAAAIIKPTILFRDEGRMTSVLQKTVEGRWLLRNFAYHDILASVTLNSDLLIPGPYWMNEEDNTLDTYFGLASPPVATIAEITALRAQIRHNHGYFEVVDDADSRPGSAEQSLSPSSEHVFATRAAQIEKSLLEWQPAQTYDHALVCLAQSYRSAALIYLYRTLRFYRLRSATDLADATEAQIDLAIHFAETMPVASLPECTLLFPLFMAGAETTDQCKVQKVRSRLGDMLAYRRFDNVRIALDVLEEVWDVKSRTNPVDWSRPYDWLDVLQRRNWRLALS